MTPKEIAAHTDALYKRLCDLHTYAEGQWVAPLVLTIALVITTVLYFIPSVDSRVAAAVLWAGFIAFIIIWTVKYRNLCIMAEEAYSRAYRCRSHMRGLAEAEKAEKSQPAAVTEPQAPTAVKPMPVVSGQPGQEYTGDVWALIKAMQRLEISVGDFGPECTRYVRREIDEALLNCDLGFIEYSPENHDCYDVQRVGSLTAPRYLRRSVVNLTTGRLVARGKIYLPANSK